MGYEYYNNANYSSRPPRNYHNEAHLPPLPASYSQTSYDGYSELTPTYSHNSYSRPSFSDPYHDSDSIPLSQRKHDSTQTIQPILSRDQDDPFVRDIDPTKRKKGRRREPPPKEGWFRGKITWVVFVLTAIQLVVFLAEIIKNGMIARS